MLAGLVCGPLAGVLCKRVGARLPLAFGVAMLALGLALLGFVHDERWQVYLGALLGYGVGLTFSLTAMAQLILSVVPQTQTGEATGINTMMRTVGGALGSQVAATLVLGSGGSPTDDGFLIAFAACAAVALVALVLCALVPAPARRASACARGRGRPRARPRRAGCGARAARRRRSCRGRRRSGRSSRPASRRPARRPARG